VLEDPGRRLWIAEDGGLAIGQLRVDRAPDGVGVVSIGLAPDATGRGRGPTILQMGLAAAARELGITRARAIVLPANLRSRRLFERAGFVRVADSDTSEATALVLEIHLGKDTAAGPDGAR
jgi:RimJ/RimL family protein N-acetyltransferase